MRHMFERFGPLVSIMPLEEDNCYWVVRYDDAASAAAAAQELNGTNVVGSTLTVEPSDSINGALRPRFLAVVRGLFLGAQGNGWMCPVFMNGAMYQYRLLKHVGVTLSVCTCRAPSARTAASTRRAAGAKASPARAPCRPARLAARWATSTTAAAASGRGARTSRLTLTRRRRASCRRLWRAAASGGLPRALPRSSRGAATAPARCRPPATPSARSPATRMETSRSPLGDGAAARSGGACVMMRRDEVLSSMLRVEL